MREDTGNTNNVTLSWCKDIKASVELVEFMSMCLQSCPEYISHSELWEGRAITQTEWSPDLNRVLRSSIINHINGQDDDGGSGAVVEAKIDGKRIAILQVSLHQSEAINYAILEDIVIHPEKRSKGVGKQILRWLEGQLKHQGYKAIFLESGLRNHGAHRFFEREGFITVSKVLSKNI